ncbi:MAG: hypothetical protein PVJ05_10440 [Candidatus Thorarchaeota archaeon]|jgi:hypothetical protein
MTERLAELEQIYSIVVQNPEEVSKETRKRFWKLVRQIKRSPRPDEQEVIKAAEIRDIMFEVDRGKTYPLGPALLLEIILGILAIYGYIWLLGTPLNWSGLFTWDLSDWITFGLRFLCVFFAIALLFPIARVIGGKWAGIKLLGMSTSQANEPAVKIDYVTFLKAPASKRKWFFFFSGVWNIIISFCLWILGMYLAWDYTALVPAIVFSVFEGAVVLSGNPSSSRGEMGNYNREKRIERVWKKNLAKLTNSEQNE